MTKGNATAKISTADEFQKTFNLILETLSSKLAVNCDSHVIENIEWLKSVMEFNVPNGKQIRGRLVEMAFKALAVEPNDDSLQLARILGWCVEMLQASFLVADDIMDNGITRRGQPCWYRVRNQGNIALNDAFLLEHAAIQILKICFGDSEVYPELLDHFLGVTFKTVMGQSMDTRMGKARDFEKYSTSLYRAIVVNKTSYYTFYLPLVLAMTLAGISKRNPKNKQIWVEMEEISLEIGTLFQIQDDYIDCFGDIGTLGKVGTDIEEGKCTWLFVTAKEVATASQLKILMDNYGFNEPSKVARVKNMYRSLDLPRLYSECQQKFSEKIEVKIQEIDHSGFRSVLISLVDTLINRDS